MAIETKFRKIVTDIPVPESESIFNTLSQYEARAMHGQLPVVWDRAEDFQVYDKWGNIWIDFTSTIFVTNTGHSNSAVVNAVKGILEKGLVHSYTFATEVRAEFLEKLYEITPHYLEKSFLLSSGTEATECAIKLMRMIGFKKDKEKVGIISFKGNMHGRTLGAEMLKGDPASSEWIGYRDPNMFHLPFPYPWSDSELEPGDMFEKDMAELLSKGLDPKTVCGFIIESYQGWGALFYPKGYIKALYDFAKKNDILITFDDIQGGFGRTGKLFAYEHYDVEPDIVCMGKGLAAGFPLSAVMARREIMDIPGTGSMSSTHSANPVSCSAGLANLKEIERLDLISESARKGDILHDRLLKLQKKYGNIISGVYGKGLLAAILIKGTKNEAAEKATLICEKAMRKGLILVHTGRESIKIGPPLTIPDEALIDGINVLEECICEVEK